MKKIFLLAAVLAVLTVAFFAAGSPALAGAPKGHATFMENEDYQSAYEQFTAVMSEAKERLSPGEYGELEKENDETMAESVKEDIASETPEIEAWATAYQMRTVYVGNALTWDWLRKNAKGVQGFYALKSGSFDGYMTIQEGDDKNAYAVYIFAAQKGGAENNGELEGGGVLDGKKISVEYGTDDSSATVTVAFDGETATVTTSDAFKESGWFGANVVIDGEYLREKK